MRSLTEMAEPFVTGHRAGEHEAVDGAGAKQPVVVGQLAGGVERTDEHDVEVAGGGGPAEVVEEPVEEQVLDLAGLMASVRQRVGRADLQRPGCPIGAVPQQLVDGLLDPRTRSRGEHARVCE